MMCGTGGGGGGHLCEGSVAEGGFGVCGKMPDRASLSRFGTDAVLPLQGCLAQKKTPPP